MRENTVLKGVAAALCDGYGADTMQTTVSAPFGEIAVLKAGQKMPFSYTVKPYRFKNGAVADIHRVAIDTRLFAIGDELTITVGDVHTFAYYDSDENTVMQTYQDNANCIAMIGFDGGWYDDETKRFYGVLTTFDTAETARGIRYTVTRDAADCKNEGVFIAYTWIACLPPSDRYDAAEMMDMELL